MPGRQAKFQSENLVAEVYLGASIAGASVLIDMGLAIRSCSCEGPLPTHGRVSRGRGASIMLKLSPACVAAPVGWC